MAAALAQVKGAVRNLFVSDQDKIINDLVGKGSASALKAFEGVINEGWNALYPDGAAPQYSVLSNLMLVIKQSTAEKRYENPVYTGAEVPYNNAEVFSLGARLVRFASAAYYVPNTDEMCSQVPSLEPQHVKMLFSESGVSCPNFFIAHDPVLDHIMLSIRGTATASDALSDSMTETVEFMGGRAHSGMFHMAQAVCDKARPKLEELMTSTGKSLVITGHSLGAGTAVLVILMLCGKSGSSGTFVAGKTTSCWPIAAPPVFGPSEMIPRWSQRSVYAFVHHVDMIPRLTSAGIFSACQALKTVDDMGIGTERRTAFLLNGMELGVELPDHGPYTLTASATSEFPKMTTIGTSILMYYRPNGDLVCRELQPAQLDNRILMHEQMVECHLIEGYIKIIDDCAINGDTKLEQPLGWFGRLWRRTI